MNSKIVFLFILMLMLLSFSNLCKANQADTIPRKIKYNKVISVTALGPTGNYSVNQAKIIKKFKKSVLIRQINLSYNNFGQKYNGLSHYSGVKYKRFYGSFSILKQFGLKNNHFNLGIGQTITCEGIIYNHKCVDKYFDGYVFAVIGYSYWNPIKRLYFNFSLYPTYGHSNAANFFPIPAITLGYCYGKGPIIPFLNYYYSSAHIISKLSIGYENSMGYSKAEFFPFGMSEGFTMSNNIVINYYPSRWYFKGQIGNSMYFNNTYATKSSLADLQNSNIAIIPSINGYSTKLFDQKPVFWNFGAGLGYQFVNIYKWQLSAEALIGTFLLKSLTVNPKPDIIGISLTDNVDYSFSLPIERKWFTSFGIVGKRKLSERLGINVGLVYKSSQIRPFHPNYTLKINDYLFSINLSYKMR